MLKRSAIEHVARDILRRYDIQEAPVDVYRIIRGEKIRLSFEEMDDEHSGFLLVENGQAAIAINRSQHPNRQRFTAAHELGHYMLHSKGADRLFVDTGPKTFERSGAAKSGTDSDEIEANGFAAVLLMPRALVIAAVGNSALTDADVNQLAVRFGVSEQAMTLRLSRLFPSR